MPRPSDVCLYQQLSCFRMVVLLSKLWIFSLINQIKSYFSVLEWPQLLDRDASRHIRFHSEFGRTCSSTYHQPQKFGMFFISVFCLCLLSLLVEWRPAGPQAQVANIWWHCLNSLHCLNHALWKPEQEKAVRKTKLMGTWQSAGYKAQARYWKWQLSRDVIPRESKEGPTPHPQPTAGSVWTLCHMR